MSETVILAVISLCGTLIGTFGGIMASNKLVTYRIEQLEVQVKKHNNLVERVYHLEDNDKILEEKINNTNVRIDLLHKGR